MTASRLALAYTMDLLLGDPEWLPHPVRLFGSLTRAGERCLRPLTRAPKIEIFTGAALTFSVASVGWALARPKNAAWQTLLAWTALATRSLLDEASAVIRAIESNDLDLARQRLARIVGRDTAHLDETEISRAVIETLAESACDGIVAPLFWLAAMGVPGAMSYKAINTLDSMIGHPEPPYRYFGRVAARLDDALNWIPARFTALALVAAARLWRTGRPLGPCVPCRDSSRHILAGASVGTTADAARMSACATSNALQIWRRDGNKHASPNAGQCEAAMAGALGVRLGGAGSYDGCPHHTPLLNAAGRPAAVLDAKAALSLVAIVSALAFGAALLAIAGRRRR